MSPTSCRQQRELCRSARLFMKGIHSASFWRPNIHRTGIHVWFQNLPVRPGNEALPNALHPPEWVCACVGVCVYRACVKGTTLAGRFTATLKGTPIILKGRIFEFPLFIQYSLFSQEQRCKMLPHCSLLTQILFARLAS